MLTQILANADTNEVGSVSTQIVLELLKTDWSADPFFMKNVTDAKNLIDKLQNVVGNVQKSAFTQDLIDLDAFFDRSFLQVKNFVHANTYSMDPVKAKNAMDIMDIFDAHDAQLYRLGYSEEIFLSLALIKDLNTPATKIKVDSLLGVSEALQIFETYTGNLNTLYQTSKSAKQLQENEMPASELKNVIRDFINNELIPYLLVMMKKDPATYANAYGVITKHIHDANIQVKSRFTRNTKQEPVSETEE